MNYKTVEEKDIEYFISICGEEKVLARKKIPEEYARDEMIISEYYPEVLVKVNNTDKVSKIMKYAHENNIPVTPRGLGTGLSGGSIALHGGIMLDLTEINKILELDEENLTLSVEPGVMLMEINDYVQKYDLFYPPDPGEKSASIGGNINTNAGGMKAVKYGVTRDYIMGLEIVLSNGKIMEVGGKVVKNSSGYSIKDLIVGSEGTLAIVTKAILKLVPLPKKNIDLLIPFDDLNKAIETVPLIIKSKNIPTAIEFMEQDLLIASGEFLGNKFPHDTAKAYLLLKIDGNSNEEIERIVDEIAVICLDAGAEDVLVANTDERQEAIWKARGAFQRAIEGKTIAETGVSMVELDECDVVVPRNRVAEFVKYTQEIQGKFRIRFYSFGHAGDGNSHINIAKGLLSKEEWEKELNEALTLMFEKAKELGGQVSGEHGVGYTKKPFLLKHLGEDMIELFKNIKLAFDPKGILNPGKII